MTIEQLKRNSLFKLCSAKEQVFLIRYAETERDTLQAIKDAYGYTQNLQAARMSLRLQNKPILRRLLMILDGEHLPTREEVISEAWNLAVSSESENIKRDCIDLTADLSGFKSNPEKLAEEKHRKSILNSIEV